ncbi:hypothetical protein BX600DRAFT_178259 [Xylariales sp. PMI_506]|nr:hypothetical protein BX600DRAFT_178259 [Xylariales sp. PMI_506]
MPSATHFESPTLAPGKKRRWDDEHEGVQRQLNFTASPHHSHGFDASVNNNDCLVFPSNTSPQRGAGLLLTVPRKIKPLPSSKRVRVSDDSDDYDQSHHALSHGHPGYLISPITSPSRSRYTTERIATAHLLNPCHICHRKPTKKSDLDSFADCQGCGQRTCYVCIRECQGWLSPTTTAATFSRGFHRQEDEPAQEDLSASFTMHDVDDEANGEAPQSGQSKARETDGRGEVGWNAAGHCSMICSRCCIERGSEGEVQCLGCLAGIEAA